MSVRFDFDHGDESMDGGGKRKEDRTDGIFHGGDVGVASSIISAVAGGDRRHHGPFPSTLKLHVRHVLWFERALSSLRFQKLLNRYPSRLLPQIYHHHLYDSSFHFFLNLERKKEEKEININLFLGIIGRCIFDV